MKNYDLIYDKLKERVDLNLLPGASFVIFENGKEVYRNHINYKGCEIFRLASMTKPITAAAALKAQELGLLCIEDEITKYLDGFNEMKIGVMEDNKPVFKSYAKNTITIKDILRHQSGLGSGDVGDYEFMKRKPPKSLEEAVCGYKNWYLDFDPKTKSAYSPTTALDIVAYIIEITSKMPYYDFLMKYIFEPLEMVDTTYKLNDEQKKRLVEMYTMDDGTMKPYPLDTYSGFIGFKEGYPSGATGLMSTLDDYSHFAMMLAGKGVYKDKRILKEESVIKMGTDIIDLPCPGVDEYYNWGYCVFVRGENADFQPLKKGTFGWSGAYSSHFFVNIEDNSGAIMMTNLHNDSGAGSPNIKVLEKAYSELKN